MKSDSLVQKKNAPAGGVACAGCFNKTTGMALDDEAVRERFFDPETGA